MPTGQKYSLIVAAAENGVIGDSGNLPWRLSADLKRFRQLTLGHHIIMGRKTFETIGRLLPGRTTVIVTRQPDYQFPGAVIVDSIAATLATTQSDPNPFVIGGAEIYRLFLPLVNELHLTRVHAEISGDTSFPEIDWNQWTRIQAERHPADGRNQFDFSFEIFRRSTRNPTDFPDGRTTGNQVGRRSPDPH